jgi:adenylate cyclase
VTPFGLSTEELGLTGEERHWRREARSAWLRLAVLAILVANLWAGEEHANLFVHLTVVSVYALATAMAIGVALVRRGPRWTGAAFIVVDALLVLSLFHEHLLPPSPSLDHALTAAGTAISFLLLSHAALWLKARLLALFAGLVLAGWLALITFAAWWSAGGDQHQSLIIGAEVALAAAFAFAAFTLILLIWDHAQLVRNAVASERRRASLSRFFAPAVVAELEARGETPALERRDAAVMFVDLRSFTRFSESVEPFEVAAMLSEYRELVIATVFAWGGTVDKFIGDGVMAVFGHPRAAPDDAERAVRCAEEVAARLAAWSEQRRRNGRVPLEAGIGIHYGPVVAGVPPAAATTSSRSLAMLSTLPSGSSAPPRSWTLRLSLLKHSLGAS